MPGATTGGTGSRGRPSGGVGATALGLGEAVDEVLGAVVAGEVDERSAGRRTPQPARTATTSATTATSRAADRGRALTRWGRCADDGPGYAVSRRRRAPRTPAATRTR